MNIGFIGAGAVGTAFGTYLARCGQTVIGYCGHHPDKIERACRLTGGRGFDDLHELVVNSDLILITTQDDHIAGACRHLCDTGGISSRHLVGHMSGACSSRALAPAAERGAAVFSLHPLQAFADVDQAVSNLPSTHFSLEGDDDRLGVIQQIMGDLGNPCFRIAPDDKPMYHLAACILSNYLVTLMDFGLSALAGIGVDRRQGFAAMRPLIDGTIANIARLDTATALTGPIARGDAATIENHLNALAVHPGPLADMYAQWAQYTLALAARKKLPAGNRRDTLAAVLAQHAATRTHKEGS